MNSNFDKYKMKSESILIEEDKYDNILFCLGKK